MMASCRANAHIVMGPVGRPRELVDSSLEEPPVRTDARESRRPALLPLDIHRRRRKPGVSAAIVAHELAQPLAALTANVDAIALYLRAESVPWHDVRQVVADLAADVARADEIVKRVLALVRNERTTLVDIPVDAWLVRCAERHRPTLARLGVAIDVECEARLTLAGDVVQLDRALDNLVVNALQAISTIRDHGHVRLRASVVGGDLVVTVSDDGPGFHAAVSAAAGVLVTTRNDGSGLGLRVARLAARAHGGRLEIGNGPSGAVVALRLPLRRCPREQ